MIFIFFLPNLINILYIFVAFPFNLPLKKKGKKRGGRLQKNTSAKQGAAKIVIIIIITAIIVMHSTVMIAVPALLSPDIFRKEEECKQNFW